MQRLTRMLGICAFILSIVFIAGCETTKEATVIPSDLPIPQLTGVDNIDIVIMVHQDIRWRMRMSRIRCIIGEITEEECEEQIAFYQYLLEGGQ